MLFPCSESRCVGIRIRLRKRCGLCLDRPVVLVSSPVWALDLIVTYSEALLIVSALVPPFWGQRDSDMKTDAKRASGRAEAPVLEKEESSTYIHSYFSTIHFYIILPPMSRSSQWSISFWISIKILYATLFSPCVLHALSISFFDFTLKQKGREITWAYSFARDILRTDVSWETVIEWPLRLLRLPSDNTIEREINEYVTNGTTEIPG